MTKSSSCIQRHSNIKQRLHANWRENKTLLRVNNNHRLTQVSMSRLKWVACFTKWSQAVLGNMAATTNAK